MKFKENSYCFRFKKLFLIAFFILLGGYGVWNSRSVAMGPKIDIFYPENGASLSSKLIKVSGQAINSSYLNLNGREILTDNSGYFSEFIALSPGYNIVKISCKDRFGETEEKVLHLYFKEK